MRREESGSALVEFTWLAIILLVPLLWIVLSVFEVQRGAFAATAAARSAARAYALAPDHAAGQDRARAAVQQVLADQGANGQRADISIDCTTSPHCHSGTSVITVTVDSAVDLPALPRLLGEGLASLAIEASHTVPIGQYVEVRGGGDS